MSDDIDLHRKGEELAQAVRFELPLSDIKRLYCEYILIANNHNRAAAARCLGITSRTLYNMGYKRP